jgi:hypothetical protein
MPKYIFKILLLFMMLASLSLILSGCLVVEELRYRFEFDTDDKNSGQFEIVYYGIKSSETEKTKIMEDYNDLLKQIAREEEDLKKQGLILKKREIKVEGKEKLCLHLKGTFQKKDIFNKENSIFIEHNKEVFLIEGIEKEWKTRSPGRVIETEKNVIIVWPSSTKSLEWAIVSEKFKDLPDNLTKIYLNDKK